MLATLEGQFFVRVHVLFVEEELKAKFFTVTAVKTSNLTQH
jgi:hypothetical protein